jgi:hypothetical protein
MKLLAAAVLALSTGCVTVAVQPQPLVLSEQSVLVVEPSALVPEESLPPTAICRDGAYSYSAHRSGTCSHHGGVAEWTADLFRQNEGGAAILARMP